MVHKTFSGTNKYYSKNVYLKKPTKEEIDSFIQVCCNNKPPKDLFDLDEDLVEIKIVELIIN